MISSKTQAIQSTALAFLSISIQQLFPKAVISSLKLVDFGFVCSFTYEKPLDSSFLEVLERQLFTLCRADPPLQSSQMLDTNLQEFYCYHGQRERACSIEAQGVVIDILRVGDFVEAVAAPHLQQGSEIRALRLLSLKSESPFYEIEGVAFGSKKELKEFQKLTEKAAKVDHQSVGKRLGLFDVIEGSYYWPPKGEIVRRLLTDWWREKIHSESFKEITTPFSDLPCAQRHAKLLEKQLCSHRDLPLLYAELARVEERVDRRLGLFQLSTYTTDQETIVCSEQQVGKLVKSSLQTIEQTITLLGLKCRGYRYERGLASAGTPIQWERCSRHFDEALSSLNSSWQWQTESPAGLAGPCLEFRFFDAMEREWPGPTLGFDFALPEEYRLRYQEKEGGGRPPVVLVRTLLNSLERIIGLEIEQNGGYLPFWLAPEQIRVLPIGRDHLDYARRVQQSCFTAGFRVEIDEREGSLSEKVFAAEAAKVPIIAIVGEQEAKMNRVAVRLAQCQRSREHLCIEQLVALAQTKTQAR